MTRARYEDTRFKARKGMLLHRRVTTYLKITRDQITKVQSKNKTIPID